MKKIIFTLLALCLLLTMASCSESASETKTAEENKTEAAESVAIADAADLINKVWEKFGDSEKFPAMGGDFETMVDGKAGKVDVTNKDYMTGTLHVAEASLEKIQDGAALTHMMNANNFTCAAYKTGDAASLATELKDSIKDTQWMCGFPETLLIYTIADDYVLAAYGNAQGITSLKTHVNEVYGSQAVLSVEESLA